MTATCTIVTQEVKDAIAIPVRALKFTPADGTPMADPRDFPRPPRPEGDSAFAKGDFPPPPPDMGAGGPPPGGPGGFGPPGGGKGGKGVFKKRSGAKKPSGSMVWVSIDGKAAPRPVKTGISDGVNIQILKGLSVGDSVVVSQETISEAKSEKSSTSNPFMPTPPGKRKK
jgi:HlyD family secretion protein